MMISFLVNLAIVLCLGASASNGSPQQTVLRGVQTSLLSMYIPSKPFTCLDGSLTIPFEFVNDDYCDCRDGSDEPGTSACPNGQFFCENKGYVGTLIPSHFVGDGVCDCCDGSDEYETSVVCNNTCFESAQKLQSTREAKRALHEAGVVKKKEIIAQAAAIRNERQKHLDQLEHELKTIEIQLKEKEELKQKAEIAESAVKDIFRRKLEEKRAQEDAILRKNAILDVFTDLDVNRDSLVSIDELQRHTELDTDTRNDFTVTEVRAILGADSVDLNAFTKHVYDKIANSYTSLPEPTKPPPEPTPLPEPSADFLVTEPTLLDESVKDEEERIETSTPTPYRSQEMEDDERQYKESYHFGSSSVPTSLQHEKHTHDSIAPEYDDETKQLIKIADHARDEYREIHDKLLKTTRQIDDLKRELNVDAGLHGEYSPIADQCFDCEEREYTYRLCMFKTAKQIPKGGGTEVIIGHWDSWAGPKNNKYSKMKYANGATCWNGPARSLVVTLQCSTEQKLSDVREPGRCEYTMLFETPLACDEAIATSTIHADHVEF